MQRLMRVLAAAFTVAGLVLILYFPALWSWQVYRWLESDQWVPLPAMLAFQNLPAVRIRALASSDPVARSNAQVLAYIPRFPRPEWLDHPQQWRGPHKVAIWVLRNAHVGLCAAVLGMIGLLIGAWISPRRRPA